MKVLFTAAGLFGLFVRPPKGEHLLARPKLVDTNQQFVAGTIHELPLAIVNRQSSIEMAERVGFEPTEQGLPVHTLSKRAP